MSIPLCPIKDHKIVVEAILYVCAMMPGVSVGSLYQVLYCADKLHMERSGSWLTNDVYHAQKDGPVPALVESMIHTALGATPINRMDGASEVACAFSVTRNGWLVIANRACNLDFLSCMAVECLGETIQAQSAMMPREIQATCKDGAWYSTRRHQAISTREIIKTLPNSGDILNYVFG